MTILYPRSGDNWFNADYYRNSHIPKVIKLLEPYGLQKFEFDLGVAGMEGPSPYFAIGYLIFQNINQFQTGFAAHGKTLMDDVPNYTRDVIVQIGEMVESHTLQVADIKA